MERFEEREVVPDQARVLETEDQPEAVLPFRASQVLMMPNQRQVGGMLVQLPHPERDLSHRLFEGSLAASDRQVNRGEAGRLHVVELDLR